MTNFFFSHCIPGSVNLLYILISRARSTLLGCQPWIKIYRWHVQGADDLSGRSRCERGWKKENQIDFLPQTPVEFFPQIRHYYQSLSVTWGSELIWSILIRRWFSELISRGDFFVWLLGSFETSPLPPQHPTGCDLREFKSHSPW